jgi:hypothetical protein
LLLVACRGEKPPEEPAPGGAPPLPHIDPDSQPSTLPPEPNSPSDPQTLAPSVGATAMMEPTGFTTPAQLGGMGGMGGFGGMTSGTGGTAPVKR